MCDGDLTITDIFNYPGSALAFILALIIVGLISGRLTMWLSIKAGHAFDWSCRTFVGCIFSLATWGAIVFITYLLVFVGTKIFC